jgi:hypothetical protein
LKVVCSGDAALFSYCLRGLCFLCVFTLGKRGLVGDAALLRGACCICASRKQAYWSGAETYERRTAVGVCGAGTAWMPFAAAMRRCSLAAFAVFNAFDLRFVRAIAIV